MPDWNVVTEGIKGILELLFGPQVPLWVPRALGWAVAAGVALVALYALLWVVSQILEVWDEKFRTRFYNETDLRRSERRRRFASRVEGKLRDLEDQEEWKDFRFAELEAEVEAEGKRRGTGILGRLRTESGLRREKSLSRALKITKEEIVLLEGDPGSGKSVALRHVAQEMARQAMSARSTRSIVPLYINLKGLDRAALAREMGSHHTGNAEPGRIRQLLESHFDETELRNLAFDLTVAYDALPGGDGTSNKARELVAHMHRTGRLAALVSAASALRPHLNWNGADGKAGEVPIDSVLIHAFVRHSFSWSRDIEEFLDEEFERGREEGTWLFLFDSFDELPDVLGSTEADDTIRRYADAIEDFLGGMGRCRGIIASRHFRGPKSRWPRFRILPLTEERRQQLIRRAELKPAVESDLRGQLGMASEAIRAMVSNPMFLGLLCEHMRQGEQFPRNTHEVFEGYITTRLERDRERLERRFHLEPSAVRAVAESAAFAMAADTTLGLSPTRAALSAAIQRLGLAMPAPLEPTLDALEYIKLGRAEGTSAQGDEPRFTFAHRRFQEYFATSIVLRDPHRVPPRRLLTDARWRETAVVLCQTQPLPVLQPLLDEARALLDGMLEEVKEYLVDVEEVLAEEADTKRRQREALKPPPIIFPWPARSLHLLGLLQDGFGGRREELADDIRDKAGWLVLSGSEQGILVDKKWALEVAGSLSQVLLQKILKDAFDSRSWLLKEIAYWQVANLVKMPEEILTQVRYNLIKEAMTEQFHKKPETTRTYLRRLDRADYFLKIFHFLTWIPRIDFVLHSSILILFLFFAKRLEYFTNFSILSISSSYIFLYFMLRGTKYPAYKPGKSPTSSIAFIRLIVLLTLSNYTNYSIFLVVLSIYTSLWASNALEAIVSDSHMNASQWPLIIITYPISKISRTAKTVFSFFTAYSILILVSLTLIYLTRLLVFILTNVLSVIGISVQSIISLINLIISAIILLSPVILFIFTIKTSMGFINVIRQDFSLHRKYKRCQSLELSILIELLKEAHTEYFRFFIVTDTRKHKLLNSRANDCNELLQLLLMIERDKKTKECEDNARRQATIHKIMNWLRFFRLNQLIKLTSESDTNLTQNTIVCSESISFQGSRDFLLWYDKYTAKDKYRLARWSPRLLDELCLLLEHVRANRREEDDAPSAAPALPPAQGSLSDY